MDTLMEYLPALLPLILHPQVRIGNKWIWIPVILFLQFLGPILYFVIGREEQ